MQGIIKSLGSPSHCENAQLLQETVLSHISGRSEILDYGFVPRTLHVLQQVYRTYPDRGLGSLRHPSQKALSLNHRRSRSGSPWCRSPQRQITWSKNRP
jgi:hypothetical protein